MHFSTFYQYALLATIARASCHQPSPYESIRQTLSLYAYAIDFKDASLFPRIFTANAVANYTGPFSELVGVEDIALTLVASIEPFVTHHQLGTTLIDISDGGNEANSTTYFTATLVSLQGIPAGGYRVSNGLYRDNLVRTDEGWRINDRLLEYMTPDLGNLTV